MALKKYECVTTKKGIYDYIDSHEKVDFQFEMAPKNGFSDEAESSFDRSKSRVVGTAFSTTEDGTGIYVPWAHRIGENIDPNEFWAFLAEFFSSPRIIRTAYISNHKDENNHKRYVRMTDGMFSRLWRDALKETNKDVYIAEYGSPSWVDEIASTAEDVAGVLETIHDVAHMGIRNIISRSGLSQESFATKFCIPKDIVEDWVTGKMKCDDYQRLMLCRQLGYIW